MVVEVDADAQILQPSSEEKGAVLPGVLCDGYAAHIEAVFMKRVDQPQDVGVIGDAQISAYFIFLNVLCADDDDQLRLAAELLEHVQLGIRGKSRKHAGSVVIIKQLAAEFQVQLVVELFNALPDMLRLCAQVLFVIKSCFHYIFLNPFNSYKIAIHFLVYNKNLSFYNIFIIF